MPTKTKSKKQTTEFIGATAGNAEIIKKTNAVDTCFYTAQPGDIITELQPNSAKVDLMQPSLVGMVKFGELACTLALWRQDTRDGMRQYYSLSVNDALAQKEAWQRKDKIEPLHRLKLYEFRQREVTDPDFATTEPFVQAGKAWWAMMWVVLPKNPEEVESYRYFLAFSPQRPAGAWSDALRTDQSSSAERLLQRRKELEEQKFFQQRRLNASSWTTTTTSLSEPLKRNIRER
jgi:hypothetical protein